MGFASPSLHKPNLFLHTNQQIIVWTAALSLGVASTQSAAWKRKLPLFPGLMAPHLTWVSISICQAYPDLGIKLWPILPWLPLCLTSNDIAQHCSFHSHTFTWGPLLQSLLYEQNNSKGEKSLHKNLFAPYLSKECIPQSDAFLSPKGIRSHSCSNSSPTWGSRSYMKYKRLHYCFCKSKSQLIKGRSTHENELTVDTVCTKTACLTQIFLLK